jgi:hypothetical protein
MATIEHCDTEANQVAHELARQALVAKASCIWVDLQPTFITALLANDEHSYLINKACRLALSKKKTLKRL